MVKRVNRGLIRIVGIYKKGRGIFIIERVNIYTKNKEKG